ncbi:hypothetical protein HDK90DRAFT_554667, partial [Phyllosticta capitalensis]
GLKGDGILIIRKLTNPLTFLGYFSCSVFRFEAQSDISITHPNGRANHLPLLLDMLLLRHRQRARNNTHAVHPHNRTPRAPLPPLRQSPLSDVQRERRQRRPARLAARAVHEAGAARPRRLRRPRLHLPVLRRRRRADDRGGAARARRPRRFRAHRGRRHALRATRPPSLALPRARAAPLCAVRAARHAAGGAAGFLAREGRGREGDVERSSTCRRGALVDGRGWAGGQGARAAGRGGAVEERSGRVGYVDDGEG